MNIANLTPGDPEAAGMDPVQLEQTSAYVEQAVREGILPLADILVARKGHIVLHRSFVHLNVAQQGYQLMPDSLFHLFSFTKILVATLIMQQVEWGRISLVRPVADYVPEFGQRGKEIVTVHHLLCHASGLPDDLPVPVEGMERLEDFVERISQQPLVFEPGTRSSYCTWSFVLLAEILRRVTGEELESLGRRLLLDPMGMADTHLGWDKEWDGRILPVFDTALEPWDQWETMALKDPRLFRGDTGAYSTALDLAACCQMMLNGGSCGSARLLSPLSVRRMTESQYAWWDTPERLSGDAMAQFVTLSKGLGWHTRGANHFRGSDLMSPRAFFHGGYGGIRAIVDPEYELITVFMTSIVATAGGTSAYFGQPGQVCHTFGTMAFAAVTDF